MLKTLFIFLISLPAQAFFFIEPGAGLALTSSNFKQSDPNTAIDHDGWGGQGELIGRVGFGYEVLRFGVVGVLAKESIRHKVTQTYPTSKYNSYSNSFNKVFFGPNLNFVDADRRLRFILEYYTQAKKTVSYSDEDAMSPFRDGDSISGYGWGIGGGFYNQLFAGTLLVRIVRYNSNHFNNYQIRTSLHDDVFTKNKSYEVSYTVSFPLDRLMFGKTRK